MTATTALKREYKINDAEPESGHFLVSDNAASHGILIKDNDR